jgi:hypothetical protein
MNKEKPARVRCANGHAIPDGYEQSHGAMPCPECGTTARVVAVGKSISLGLLFPTVRQPTPMVRAADFEANIRIRVTELESGSMLVDLVNAAEQVVEQIIADDEGDVGLGIALVLEEQLRERRRGAGQ